MRNYETHKAFPTPSAVGMAIALERYPGEKVALFESMVTPAPVGRWVGWRLTKPRFLE